MKIGVFSPVFGDRDFEPMLDAICLAGLEAVEISTAAHGGDRHCRPDELLANKRALRQFRNAIERRGLLLSALSCHSNPLHPDPDTARRADEVYRTTVRLANALGVRVVNCFSGCPGDGPRATHPNWVTCAWPDEYLEVLRWQWDDVVFSYWHDAAGFAAEHGVQIGFEMHPGFVVYNPRTLLRLREAVGSAVCANLDPSHLFWQQIDPITAIRELGAAIVHVHAKDVAIDSQNTSRNGVLDTAPYAHFAERSWTFRTVGYGHDLLFWRSFVSALRIAGYDYVLSIEHEDGLASPAEGLSKAVRALKDVTFAEVPTDMWSA